MKRRRFLAWLGSAIVVLAGVAFVGRRSLKGRARAAGQRARELILGVDPAEGTSRLTPEVEANLASLGSAVLPLSVGDAGRAITLDTLRWRATTSPGYASEFRRASAFLDSEAQKKYGDHKRFALLTAPETAALTAVLLDGILASQLSASPRGYVMRLALSPRFLRRYRLRRHVVNEILEGYYRSPRAWARLGYRSFPGACAGMIYSEAPAAAPSA